SSRWPMSPGSATPFTSPACSTPFSVSPRPLSVGCGRAAHRIGMDLNISEETQKPYVLNKHPVTLGCNRFDYHASLKNLIANSKLERQGYIGEFSKSEFNQIINKVALSPLVTWEYSSPTVADVYKYLDTTAHLQLSMRYNQCEDLERGVNDPVVHLRKQAQMDCLKRVGLQDDINSAFESCFQNGHLQQGSEKPFTTLEDPGDGGAYIGSGVDVTDKTLNRVKLKSENIDDITSLIPRILISPDSIDYMGPNQRIRQVASINRKNFLSLLENIILVYKRDKTISVSSLEELSVAGVPLTEAQVKNIALLDDTTAYLAMNKIASQLAYLKTMDLYTKALEFIRRVLNHPAIEPGYKRLMQQGYDFIVYEMDMLKQERGRLTDYFSFMGSILDNADAQRLKILGMIKDESNYDEKKGLFNLTP
ncbi:MAG: hypothetical protein WCH62_06455, partial [Candidatus Omnitrophota bacterium]